MNRHTQRVYVLGHEPEELRRLILQAVVLQPITARLLQNAGIGPGMRVLGGPTSPIYAWYAESIRTLLPQLAQMGMATDDLTPVDTLGASLQAAAVAARSQVQGPGQVCAWVRP
jgi:hypothetical protein